MATTMFIDSAIRIKKVRNGIYARQYRTGVICIDGYQFVMHSMTSAIKAWRNSNKIK